jgi:phosphoribosylanthranilate isomerase
MRRTRIKICGVCSGYDAQSAADAGADAIGMIRVESAGRYIDLETARRIVDDLPAFVTPVLVYLDTPAEVLLQELKLLGRPATVQLNGEQSPQFIQQLKGIPVIRAVRVDGNAAATLKTLAETKLPNLVGLVLESPGQIGGSGVENDWGAIDQLRRDANLVHPLIAAGGLTPANVGQVVRRLQPFGVDVSSGVEEQKRVKSIDKIRDFVLAAREADEASVQAYREWKTRNP